MGKRYVLVVDISYTPLVTSEDFDDKNWEYVLPIQIKVERLSTGPWRDWQKFKLLQPLMTLTDTPSARAAVYPTGSEFWIHMVDFKAKRLWWWQK